MELDVAPNLKFAQNRPVLKPNSHSLLTIENDFLLGEFDPITGLLQKIFYLKQKRWISKLDLTGMKLVFCWNLQPVYCLCQLLKKSTYFLL
jgi:hypothetical protein